MILKTKNGNGIKALGMSMLTVLLVFFSSCSSVFDDLDECPRGVVMRFVFDYNLEFANAFPSQVDCLEVFIFDKEGNLVSRQVEKSEVLSDENWRLTLDLPAGDYQAVAYGGMECDLASFSHSKAVDQIKNRSDLDVLIHDEFVTEQGERAKRQLHDLYYGSLSFTVNEGLDYDQVTMEMMRDTNHIRVVLQHIDNTPVDDNDFTFEILDDNTHLDCNNLPVSRQLVSYRPWIQGVLQAGENGKLPESDEETKSGDNPTSTVQVAFAEMSTSRLIYNSSVSWTHPDGKKYAGPRLLIKAKDTGRHVVDIPLNNYLLLLKSESLGKMQPQEFLDRASRYNMIFFLDRDNAWVRVAIEVGPWTVRIDNIEY